MNKEEQAAIRAGDYDRGIRLKIGLSRGKH